MSALSEAVWLRDAGVGDLEAIAALEAVAFPIPWKRDYFAVEIDAPYRFNRVARGARGELAGYVFCAWAAGEVHVNKIAVSEDLRRNGIASLLMRDIFVFAGRVKADEIYLEVRMSNIPARMFYRRLGFRDAGRRPAYYADGEDALVMLRTKPFDPRFPP